MLSLYLRETYHYYVLFRNLANNYTINPDQEFVRKFFIMLLLAQLSAIYNWNKSLIFYTGKTFFSLFYPLSTSHIIQIQSSTPNMFPFDVHFNKHKSERRLQIREDTFIQSYLCSSASDWDLLRPAHLHARTYLPFCAYIYFRTALPTDCTTPFFSNNRLAPTVTISKVRISKR